jgi:hypothetical protein
MTAERQSNEKLQAIRCDNAGEYKALATRLERENGVVVEFTTPYTPEQNGVAERLNRTLTTKIRAMLAEADLPQWLWGEAAYAACYLHNRTPRHYGGNHVMTPKEMWTVRKPDLGHLRVFGCVAYAQLAREQRNSKLDQTSIRGIFVGYTPTTRQYRVYDPETGVVGRYSTVRFDEERKGGTLLAPSGNIPPWTEVVDAQGQNTQGQDGQSWDSTLPDGDTIVVRAPSPEPRVDRGRQTPSPSPPQSRSPSPPAPPESMQDAGETPGGRQTRSGRNVRSPQRYQGYQIWVDRGRNLILALYVDDIVLFARETQEIHRIKAFLTDTFHMKDLGPIHTVLGMRVRRNRAQRTLWIDQTHYIRDILKEFQHEGCRAVSTPADGYEHLQIATAQDALFADVATYQRALG